METAGDIVFSDIDSGTVKFFSNDIGLNSINFNIINHDDDNLMIMILKLLTILDLWLGIIDISNTKHVKIDKK